MSAEMTNNIYRRLIPACQLPTFWLTLIIHEIINGFRSLSEGKNAIFSMNASIAYVKETFIVIDIEKNSSKMWISFSFAGWKFVVFHIEQLSKWTETHCPEFWSLLDDDGD